MSFLSIVSEENLNEEIEIQEKLNELITNGKSFIFETGAGAGKTFALMKCLNYILENYDKTLKYYRQNVLCITYTNVAKDKIKSELGNSQIVDVSTIHEKVWDIISSYQIQLIEIHKEKLIEETENIKNMIESDDLYEIYSEDFKNEILINRELFYKYYSSNANEFRNGFFQVVVKFIEKINSVDKFKKFVNNIIKYEENNSAILSINENTILRYDARYSRDVKRNMIISHDSVLEYAFLLINQNKILKKIITDKYPIIFIDEFQDTNEYVLKILNELHDYSIENKNRFILGFFGDSYQKIYSSGVGKIDKDKYLTSLETIFKKYNRRSSKEVIDVCNTIRASKNELESIYSDAVGGSVKFYSGNSEHLDNFIDELKVEYDISVNNSLTCLLLTNSEIAKKIGIGSIYEFYANASIYRGLNYDKLNQELLQNDKTKLGTTQRLLFNIIEFKYLIEHQDTYIKEIVSPKKILNKFFLEYKEFLTLLKQIKGNTLIEYINSFFEVYKNTQNTIFSKVFIERLGVGLDFKTLESFNDSLKNYFIDALYKDTDDYEDALNNFFNIELNEFLVWFDYINDKQTSDIQYYTFHSTKGLEFENVLLVMGNSFGRSREYFDFYFRNLKNYETLEDKDKLDDIRNLLYVASSRAIKNLIIYYIDDITLFKDEIVNIFGETEKYNI